MLRLVVRTGGIYLLLGLIGCAPASAPPAAGSSDATATSAQEAPQDAKIAAEIAKLPEADQKLAKAQKICPVSEAPLGSMAGLTKVSLEGGREVFVCCEGCIDALKSDPAPYLAKLDQQPGK